MVNVEGRSRTKDGGTDTLAAPTGIVGHPTIPVL